METATIRFIEEQLAEARRLAKIGWCPHGHHLPQYYTYSKQAIVLKSILTMEGACTMEVIHGK